MIGDGAANEAGYVLVLPLDVVVGLHRLLKCSSHITNAGRVKTI